MSLIFTEIAIYELHPLYFPLFVAALICNSNTWRSNYSLWIPRHLTLHWTINLSLSRWWANSSSMNLESPVQCFSFRFGFLFWRATVQRDRSRQMLHMQIETACWKYLEVEGEKVRKATWGRGEKDRGWKSNKGMGGRNRQEREHASKHSSTQTSTQDLNPPLEQVYIPIQFSLPVLHDHQSWVRDKRRATK